MSIGQEIGVTPVQVISMVSAIANDGVYTAPRVVAGATKANVTAPQTIAFKPPASHRVVSTMTAAEMREMMEQVVLFGTARRAILDGYTSAGKTGTAQKVDPQTGRYSKTKYVGSFAGFAPVSNPAVSIIVVLDSAEGLHQGGQVSAPVFARIAQQVLAYMHVPHDADPKRDQFRQLRAHARDEDVEDSVQAHMDDALADAAPEQPAPPGAKSPTVTKDDKKLLAAAAQTTAKEQPPLPAPASSIQPNGTVVLDVGGGPTVPSFIGKSMRAAIETAQSTGIELDAVGSGVAREQSPAPGAPMPPGGKVAVRFAR
jgi:cell division protein FtsI (penicillin-binding protein 3)